MLIFVHRHNNREGVGIWERKMFKQNKEDYRTKGGLDMCTALRELEEDARREGLVAGMKKGSHLMNELNRRLIQDGRTEDLFRSIQDTEYQKKLLEEYGMEGTDVGQEH